MLFIAGKIFIWLLLVLVLGFVMGYVFCLYRQEKNYDEYEYGKYQNDDAVRMSQKNEIQKPIVLEDESIPQTISEKISTQKVEEIVEQQEEKKEFDFTQYINESKAQRSFGLHDKLQENPPSKELEDDLVEKFTAQSSLLEVPKQEEQTAQNDDLSFIQADEQLSEQARALMNEVMPKNDLVAEEIEAEEALNNEIAKNTQDRSEKLKLDDEVFSVKNDEEANLVKDEEQTTTESAKDDESKKDEEVKNNETQEDLHKEVEDDDIDDEDDEDFEPDDLTQIKGVGKKIERVLNNFNIYTYEQIANWTESEIKQINKALKFKGRVSREDWVQSAKELAQQKASKKKSS